MNYSCGDCKYWPVPVEPNTPCFECFKGNNYKFSIVEWIKWHILKTT